MIQIILFFHRCPDVQDAGERFHLAQSDESGNAQETVVFKQNGRAAGVALFHFGGSDEIVAVKTGDDALGRRQVVF